MISSDWRSQSFEKKSLAARLWVKWVKIGPETRFFCHFIKFGSLVVLEVAFNNNWRQCLRSIRGKIFEKMFLKPKFAPKGPKSSPKLVFFHFLKFCSLVFFQIAYNDSLQQCITSSRDKSHGKNILGPNLGQNEPKSGPKLGFLPFSQAWFISFPLNCIGL